MTIPIYFGGDALHLNPTVWLLSFASVKTKKKFHLRNSFHIPTVIDIVFYLTLIINQYPELFDISVFGTEKL